MLKYKVVLKSKDLEVLNVFEFFDSYFAKNIILKSLTNKSVNKKMNYPKYAILIYNGVELGKWSTDLYKQKRD